jgi:hypothetical protein
MRKGTAMQVSAWLEDLYKIYTNYGFKEEARQVLIDIRANGPKVHDELKLVSHSIDFPKAEIDRYIRRYTEGPPQALLNKITKEFIFDKEEIKSQIFKHYKKDPLPFIITTQLMDGDGRFFAKLGDLENDLEGHLAHRLTHNLALSGAFLNIVFNKIIEEGILTREDFFSSITRSPLFQEERKAIIARGIDSFFNKDFITGIHILIPQIEEAIRHLVELCNGVILKSKNGGFQLRTLDELLRDEIIKRILGENIQFYLRVVLTDQRGWNIRNKVCHGIATASTFSEQTLNCLIHILLILGTVRNNSNA